MRARGFIEAAALWPSLLTTIYTSSAFLGFTVLAKNNNPTISETNFKSLPIRLEYFRDSDVVIYQTEDHAIYRSDDAGSNFRPIKDIPVNPNVWFIPHEFDDKRAYILTSELTHYRTDDRGETWTEFFINAIVSEWQPPSQVLRFHADNPDYIIFNGMDCEGIYCAELAMYTTDGFATEANFLRPNTRGCWWAKSSKAFTTGDKDLDKDRSLCIVAGELSSFKQDRRVVISDNFFSAEDAGGAVQQFEPNIDMNRPVSGVVSMVFVHGYLLVATVSENTAEMGLYVTDDTLKWHRAMFHGGHRIDQDEYTVLEGTDYSIQIDVMNTKVTHPMGTMFTSNSNGTLFTRNIEHTNRNKARHVDFEKISGIQGIFLVNTVDNWEDIQNYSGDEQDGSIGDPKKKVTYITFDDGRTFHDITADGERLHLHSVTELNNVGRVFSSPAPGLVMGIGNTGPFLRHYSPENTTLFVSDDAGLTWSKGLEGPHKYEFGDQGSILVAIHDSGKAETEEFKYSLNHGKDWVSAVLPRKIKPWILTTTQDSTTLKFILVGEDLEQYYTYAIDFDGIHERTCSDDDMEDWWARVDEDGKPTCIMGQKQKYRRRKKDADCFIKQEFKDPVPESEPCDCSDIDFECDFNFVFDDDKKDCVLAEGVGIAIGEDDCKDGTKTFMGSSGWRLIPGNACVKRKDEKDTLVEQKCSESTAPPNTPGSGKVESGKHTVFEGDYNSFMSWYLERGDSSSQSDETLIMRPVRLSGGGGTSKDIFITHDHGKTWLQPDILNSDVEIWDIVPHRYFKDMVYFIPFADDNVIYTTNRGESFHTFKPPSEKGALSFHPDKKDWIIWVGTVCEGGKKNCRKIASLSTDRGDHWETIGREVDRCEFTGSSAYPYPGRNEKQIFCLVHTDEDNSKPLQIQRSNDFFQEKLPPIENVSNFATMAEFIVVAVRDEENETLHARASLDGVTFADAHFPYGFVVDHQAAYTVLDSSTHAINLFVVTEEADGREYGSIIKSNSNGTSYVLSASGVNCDSMWYVDFEKMLGLEGVVLVNMVANMDKPKERKKIQSKISHNDGGEWTYLPPPQKDVDGKKYACSSKGDARCALHIHGYTERIDRRKTYSSESAIGLMFGIGNVGQYLGEKKDADTFMTRDGGLTWVHIMKGQWIWQYGDQGSIIILAQVGKPTKIVKYTIDEGKTWQDYEFAAADVTILDLTTLRSGSSRNFIVWGLQDGHTMTTNIDFSGLADRECEIKDDAKESDYYLWSPRHPLMEDNCLFGHQSQYFRKKPDVDCFNNYRLQHKYNERSCVCARSDFECDFNYELDNHGACRLVPGFQPITKAQYCADNPEAVTFYEPTGYRRIPLTTCVEGKQMDKQSKAYPCPGKEEEFEKAHRVSGWGVFFAVVIPAGLASAVGWWVWKNWNGKFGQIRLGEQNGFSTETLWVKYPVMAAAGLVAVLVATPAVIKAVWRSGKAAAERWGLLDHWQGGGYTWLPGGGGTGNRTFTTRDSFARGRTDYDMVDEDEGELLGEESDEEV